MRSTETTVTVPYPSSSRTPTSPSSFTLGAAPSLVYVNIVALHTALSIWGPDALDFKPSRWLQPAVQQQQFFTPPRGTYLPWSGGPRACPGQKMSQVEFVTVFATLFRRCTVEPALRPGESADDARRRLLGLMRDSQPILTLQMNRPEEVRLRWARR
ncbi:cytochrome P450 [Colletotrichum sublineola]|nr:cytochrome P450 [Colletotrichum sublineola]